MEVGVGVEVGLVGCCCFYNVVSLEIDQVFSTQIPALVWFFWKGFKQELPCVRR